MSPLSVGICFNSCQRREVKLHLLQVQVTGAPPALRALSSHASKVLAPHSLMYSHVLKVLARNGHLEALLHKCEVMYSG